MKNLLRSILGHKKNNIRKKQRQSCVSYDSLAPKNLLASVFYVDAAIGDDSNPGTAEQPWATYLPIVWAYDQADPNIGRVNLQAGDEVIFRAGLYDETFQNPSDINTGTFRGLYLRGLSGTEENPIVFRAEPGAIINPAPANNSDCLLYT